MNNWDLRLSMVEEWGNHRLKFTMKRWMKHKIKYSCMTCKNICSLNNPCFVQYLCLGVVIMEFLVFNATKMGMRRSTDTT